MAEVNSAPKLTKKRKLGKNKKKSWRASKVEDVEEFLDDERRQLRTGGLVSEKADSSLFVFDTARVTATKSVKRSKRLRKDKPLKCYALLQPDPHSKPVRTADGENFQKGRKHKSILERLQARSQSRSRRAAAKQSAEYTEKLKALRKKKKKLPEIVEDIWGDSSSDLKSQNVKPPKKYGKKPSALRATLVPHPGASFNPSYDDHQDLLHTANNTEVNKMKKEKQIYNALDAKFPTLADAPNESTYLMEMAAGLVSDSDEESSEHDEDEAISVNPPVRREDRKTKKQKRVEKEEKIKAGQRLKESKLKQRENMVLRIPTLKSDINKLEKKRQNKVALRRKRNEEEKFKTKRLSKHKFEEPDLDLKLSTELVGSLREVKPEGHLLKDMYKSLQRRNIIEPRIKQKKTRKYKKKVFEKKGHKAVKL